MSISWFLTLEEDTFAAMFELKWSLKPFKLHLIGALKQAFVPLNPLVTLARDIINLDLGFSSYKSLPFLSFWQNP